MRYFVKALSILFHPLLLPTLVFSLIFFYLPEMVMPLLPPMFGAVLSIIGISTLLIPCAVVYTLYKMNVVATADITDRKDRFIPQALSTLVYAGTTYLLYQRLSLVPCLYIIMCSVTICMLTVTVVNFYWKISAHATGMGGFCALAFYIAFHYPYFPGLFIVAFTSLLVAALVMSSRMYLQVHTLGQVTMGFLVGFSVGLVGVSNIS